MRHELRNADGDLLWAGDPEDAQDVSRLRALLWSVRDRAMKRVDKRGLRARRRAAGLCADCGEAVHPGRARCVVDLTLAARRAQERRDGRG